MADGWRGALTTVTETVFPSTKVSNGKDRSRLMPVDSYLASDLVLQVILYFNAYYSGFWMIICIVTFIAKYQKLDSVYKFVLVVIYIVMGIIEAGRLYLGYTGNLQEKCPYVGWVALEQLTVNSSVCNIKVYVEEASFKGDAICKLCYMMSQMHQRETFVGEHALQKIKFSRDACKLLEKSVVYPYALGDKLETVIKAV
eukprot:Seg3524.2 transcript_id=Seg3524.2/GoldUCD/mRNA.D3Y31 product="Transmembrane protein 17A" protein_id=Seg3524.2/GoldUCD/D3Y31